MPALPSGTVTFLFSDIEGSTALWERDLVAMQAAVDRHLTLLRTSIEACGGVLFKVVGDAVQAAFPTAPAAVAAALDAQRLLVAEPWPEQIRSLPVRMAVHTAAAAPQDGDYLAPGLNRLARLMAAAHGGQVLLSLASQDLARDALPTGASLQDLGEHPLRDLYRPEHVFQLRHPDLPGDFPPIRTLATRPNNLPLQPTPFLGRGEQVARIVALLKQPDLRLLTITGSGGVGKTRVALQVAADLLDAFRDGVWFVDLSALTEASQVPSAVASALGVREEGREIASWLAALLAEKQLLLVLDNFERVVEAASFVAALLARAPDVKVLTTSRIPLHAYGEHEFSMLPFPMPDLAQLPSVEVLSQYDAVRLFVDRAQAVQPDFAVTNANAPAVAEICHRLDGLPLAIELAAAFVKMLPPEALLRRLEQRLPLLTGGARTLPARQQTMRNTIAWSHDLLPLEEQILFRRLAVFPGGCTIEAAEAVATMAGTLSGFTAIAALVDKSLLRRQESMEHEPRFRMLEMVREYGLEQLEASDEAEATRRRLATWCVALVEQAEPEQYGGNIAPHWILRFDEELPNLEAAITWFLAWGEATSALRLLAAAEDYWIQRQRTYLDLHHWLNAALTAAPNAPARDRAIGHWLLTLANSALGNPDAALLQAERMLVVTEEVHDPASVGFAHLANGVAWEGCGDLEQAAAAFAKAIPFMRATGLKAGAWYAQAEHADKLVARGDLATGVPLLDEALTRLRQVSSDWFVVGVINQRGHAALREGDLHGAARWFTETINVARSLQQTGVCLSAMAGLAGVALAQGQAERAIRLLAAVSAVQDSMKIWRVHSWSHQERITRDARAALEQVRVDQEWSSGRLIPLDEAVNEALAIAGEMAAKAPAGGTDLATERRDGQARA